MPFVTRPTLLWLGVLAFLGATGAAAFVWSGVYGIGADDPHTRPVFAVLETLRDRSIDRQARDIPVPDLSDPALLRQGAGNYAAMCAGCHRAPGMDDTELSRGLYPEPPALAVEEPDPPAHQFWAVKHGIKASGMPAWGRSMDDRYIWGLVAFLQKLPTLSPEQYHALVESSGGHSHGGGEDHVGGMDHEHGVEGEEHHEHGVEGEEHEHAVDDDHAHDHAAATDATAPAPATYTHRHADGTVETHTVKPAAPEEPATDAEEPHHHEH